VAVGMQVIHSLAAAEKLAQEGIDCEVVDLRTVAPLDKQAILTSLEKTGRLVVVEEGHKTGGVGAEIAGIVAEEGIYDLLGPIKRVAALDVPIPYHPVMESFVLPSEAKIMAGIREVMQG